METWEGRRMWMEHWRVCSESRADKLIIMEEHSYSTALIKLLWTMRFTSDLGMIKDVGPVG